jgi:queuine/archaeosine tRNA-ribosyltransferase
MSAISFDIVAQAKDSKARAGILHTPHGDILTPAFVAVGTQGTVKSVSVDMLTTAGVQTIIANTYHLHLQPGSDVVREAGGLHAFMGWNKPLLTDSGGFQVFSLGAAYGKTVSKVTKAELDAEKKVASVYDPDASRRISTGHCTGLHRSVPSRYNTNLAPTYFLHSTNVRRQKQTMSINAKPWNVLTIGRSGVCAPIDRTWMRERDRVSLA